MISKIRIFLLLAFFCASKSYAVLKVMASTENLKTVVKEIGGAHVEVESYCKGNQDPHYLEAKPSFMIKTHQADLVIAMGLELEVAWLPKVLSGGRNLKVMKGKKGYLEVGPLLDVLEVHTGHITRADGDVHPDGNPHVDLDPIRIGQIGKHVAARLALLDSKNKGVYEANAQKLMERMEAKTKVWAKRIAATGTKKIVTYHKTLTYFIDRFGLQSAAILEPLPGVPPTAAHILDVIKVAKQAGVKLTLVENIYDDSVAKRVAKELPGMRVVKVPISVGGRQDILKLDDVFEALVVAFEGDSK